MKKLLAALLLIFAFSCEESTPPEECPGDVLCTQQFVSLSVKLFNDSGPILLSSYEVVNLDNNSIYQFDHLLHLLPEGEYIVISDGQINEIQRAGTNLRLNGILASGGEYSVDLKVGHNCCHVTAISGPFTTGL